MGICDSGVVTWAGRGLGGRVFNVRSGHIPVAESWIAGPVGTGGRENGA